MKKTKQNKAEEVSPVSSYADRVHRYLAYKYSQQNKQPCGLMPGSDGLPRFGEHRAYAIWPGYGDSPLPTQAILKLINETSLPDKYKRAQVKAIARIGMLYGANADREYMAKHNGTLAIQIVDRYLVKTKNNMWQKKRPNFIILYKAIKDQLEQDGNLHSLDNLERLCEEHLLEREKGDPTRKFREASKKRATNDEYHQECWMAEREHRWDP